MRLIDADVLMDLLKKGWKTTSLDTFTHHTIDRTDVEGTPTVEAIPIKWLESFEPLMTKDAYWGIKEAISQWNGDYEIIDEARRCIDSAFREAMR